MCLHMVATIDCSTAETWGMGADTWGVLCVREEEAPLKDLTPLGHLSGVDNSTWSRAWPTHGATIEGIAWTQPCRPSWRLSWMSLTAAERETST